MDLPDVVKPRRVLAGEMGTASRIRPLCWPLGVLHALSILQMVHCRIREPTTEDQTGRITTKSYDSNKPMDSEFATGAGDVPIYPVYRSGTFGGSDNILLPLAVTTATSTSTGHEILALHRRLSIEPLPDELGSGGPGILLAHSDSFRIVFGSLLILAVLVRLFMFALII